MSVDFSRLPREKLIALLLESRKQADAAKTEAAVALQHAAAAKAEAAVALQHAAEVEVRLIFPKRNTPPRQSSSPKLLP